MQQIVSITSQGQITIPAMFRRLLGLDQYNKAAVSSENNKIIVEPIPDIMKLAGILQKKALKGKTIDQIVKKEEKAMEKEIARKYIKNK